MAGLRIRSDLTDMSIRLANSGSKLQIQADI